MHFPSRSRIHRENLLSAYGVFHARMENTFVLGVLLFMLGCFRALRPIPELPLLRVFLLLLPLAIETGDSTVVVVYPFYLTVAVVAVE